MPPRVMIPDEIAPRPAFHSLRPVVMSARGVVVAGTPSGGEQTEYPAPLPDASICPPAT